MSAWRAGVGRGLAGTVLLLALGVAPAAAQMSFTGEWAGRYHEDQPDRVPGEEPGNFSGLPINEAARLYGDSWDVARHSVLEHQCAPYTIPYIYHGPNQFRIWETHHPDTQELLALEQYMGTFQQRRTIWLDGRPHPPAHAPHTWMGFSTGQFHGDVLTVTTTHIKAGYFRRSGIPNSDHTTVVEHYIRHGNVLSHVTIATDPVYLTEPYIRSQEFVLMERGNTNWLYNCEYAQEVPELRHRVPHYLPGQNPWTREYGERYGVPQEGVRGGAATTYPEYMERVRSGQANGDGVPAPAVPDQQGLWPGQEPRQLVPGELDVVHVQGNVYMVVGAGGNVAVQVGEDGVLVIDTGTAEMGERLLEAIRELSDKDIRWIVNTSLHPDHTGGNETISFAGRTVNGNPAAIVAHENAAVRMVRAGVPDRGRPYNTYFEDSRDFPFNGEPVILYHPGSAHTDTDTIVKFRRSDVIVAGNVFRTDGYPIIDVDNGGTVQGTIDALNLILDLAVPSKSLQEGGTYVIPARGRLTDEADVVMYRDMVWIIRDRIQHMVAEGMTLEQVRAARPTLDYDGRYGGGTGPTSTAAFVEAVYRDLSRGRTSENARSGR
jgi:cyclase